MIALALVLFLFALPAKADIPSVVNIQIHGINYQVTELVEHHHCWLHPSQETWRYKLLDSPFTLVIHKPDYIANKQLLKTLPDYRDFYTRHPYIQKAMFISNMASLALNVLTLIRI